MIAPEAILFDIDDTLYDRGRAQRETACLLCERFPGVLKDIEISAVVEAFLESDRLFLDVYYATEPGQLGRAGRMERFLELLGLSVEAAEEMTACYVTEYPRMFAPVEGAETVIPALAKRFPLGIISNGMPDVQYQKVETLGLTSYFECVVLSEEVGFRKPDIRIFRETARRIGSDLEKCLFVGDSYKHDVVGAKNAGMRACWLNPGGVVPEGFKAIMPDLDVRSLHDILTVL